MARALWKGLVNFGLVNIPVELHPAVREHRPRFRLLHRKDLSPIRQERVCQLDGDVVAWEDLVKGYEIERGRFVTVTEDDFKTAALERSRSIDILEFVTVKDIDVRYWETPYAVVPARGAEHSYALLARALGESGRAGIAKYVMRERQHLAALQVVDGALMLTTMRFPEDLADVPTVKAGALATKELALARQLIDGMSGQWEPERFTDDYVPALMKVIEAKARGGRVSRHAAPAARSTPVSDLVERLRQSLAASKREGRAKERGSAKRSRPARVTKLRPRGKSKPRRPSAA